MRRIGLLLLLLTGLSGCSLTREPKPPRAPEELRRTPDEARYQRPDMIYPGYLLNQDASVKASGDGKTPPPNMRRGMTSGGAGGGIGSSMMGGP